MSGKHTPRRITAQYEAYARQGALADIERILKLFPDLRARVAHGPALDDAIGDRWRETADTAATTANGLGALSLRDAIRRVLSTTPQRGPAVAAAILAGGYQHRGTSRLGNRISQELVTLVKQGEARKTAGGWVQKGARR